LHIATQLGDKGIPIVKALLDNGANPEYKVDSVNPSSYSAFCHAVHLNASNAVKIFLEYGYKTEINEKNCGQGGWSALYNAYRFENVEMTKMLVDAGADKSSAEMHPYYCAHPEEFSGQTAEFIDILC
jgi:ankyrin repeat protein